MSSENEPIMIIHGHGIANADALPINGCDF